MDIKNACISYFNGFNELFSNKSVAQERAIGLLKVISLATVIIPLVFGIAYGVEVLKGRVSSTPAANGNSDKVSNVGHRSLRLKSSKNVKKMTAEAFIELLKSGSELPKKVRITGDLDLDGEDLPDLESLPIESLLVDGDLDLTQLDLTSLPNELIVKGSLSINACGSLTSLPKGLKVEKDFWISDSAIESLPENLYVGGDVNAWEGSLVSVSTGIHIRGDLDLRKNGQLNAFHGDITIGGKLNLGGCQMLTQMGSKVKVGGDFCANGSGLISLPEGFHVGGDLYLVGCTDFTTLPNSFFLGGDLSIRDCNQVTSLPDCVVQLGIREDGLFRKIIIAGTGISRQDAELIESQVPEEVSVFYD